MQFAELLMELTQESGEHPVYELNYVKNLLSESLSNWKALDIEPLQVRSLFLLAEFEYRAGDHGLSNAKKYIDEAK